jgi:RNA polymerase sigma factor (sigma-70 family)
MTTHDGPSAVRSAPASDPRPRDDDFDLVGQYLRQIASTPLLTAAEEVDLAKRIEAGVYATELLRRLDDGEQVSQPRPELEALSRDGAAARDHMIRANLRLVVSAARKYHRRLGISFLDLIQDGNLGLIRAVEKFDYTKGFKFSTYAMWWIRQAIERGRADHERTIRLPMHVVESLSKLRRTERDLGRDLGRDPTIDELAAETGLSIARIEQLRDVSRGVVSLDTPVGEDGETQLGDLVEDVETPEASDIVEYQAMTEDVRALVASLPPRQAAIIQLRFGLRDGRLRSLQQVADEVGLTRERVRQLEKDALNQLRQPTRREALAAWAN